LSPPLAEGALQGLMLLVVENEAPLRELEPEILCGRGSSFLALGDDSRTKRAAVMAPVEVPPGRRNFRAGRGGHGQALFRAP
jgi:hypothetical protein